MANVTEREKWESGIYQLETTDPVMGGEDGIDNLQARQLANRTLYLKKIVETPATTTQLGRVKLNSSVNSISETEAATPLAIKTTYDLVAGAVKKTGDVINGQLTFENNANGIKFNYENPNWATVIRPAGDNFSFYFYDAGTKNWVTKLRYTNGENSWRFENIGDVTINGKSILKTGDGGLLSYTQTISDIFSPDIKTGFYRWDRNSINTPVNGSLGYFQKISWNADESTVLAHGYNANRLFIGYKHKSTGDIKFDEILKFGDCGIGAPTGTTVQNLDEHLNSGFYGTNTSKISDLPFTGGNSASSLLVLPSESPYLKVEQLSVVNGRVPKIYYRTDTKNDGKQAWYEAITTANANQILPVGIPQPWPQSTPPVGWLECNGSVFDKNQYQKLAIAYPSGYLPDLRGEFIRGWDNGRCVDSGRGVLSWQGCDIQSHNHSQILPLSNESGFGTPWGSGGGNYEEDFWYTTGDCGGNETRPRNIAFMYIVRAE